ncbi:beta-glucoside-specific PTS transporter subunit IIABC [Brevibacillus laterosporus]|uniref:beta-glucoside-specific PTS transporter subunit IIABC n=1 Tax=Brevibacillus laterosporus TaxID=1465 RepID=UPI0018CF0AC9|nr:beta-glucoside-specific PTS transporter subunit IIABC [Brevibacillus laterosporus]MBG9796311.1 PTS beta-glucoside transporter subunit IIA [Brevibacillus laterosporus]MCR8937316.1 beta-glucoside-specific PTS transporter subunit IIABC [Brevibacillus laterosporus]MCZ0839955.1 beta-glucoside-specific PTS transporter subunit IIABC [Brevibacillus laterosporus]MCZ0843475.1 beta-glucoside-specific PTS transporter subunit IIABC [Brevibacillus laterosporus]MED1910125.1 beta-glucoside-specific PTS tra
MDQEKVAKEIVALVGGKENIAHVTHCMTRLRFNLHDDQLANKEMLEKTKGVMGTMKSGGQFQVIIGNDVAQVYKEIMKSTDVTTKQGHDKAPKKKQNPISAIFDVIAGVFTPILPAIAGAGMIKGLLSLAATFGWMSPDDSTYLILNAIGDGAFYFLPLILAFSAANKFGNNPFVAVSVAAAVLHPQLTALLGTGQNTSFLGMPVTAVTYASSVIPIVITIWLASYVEKAVDKAVHKSMKLILVPMITLLIVVPLMLIAIGPIGTIIGNGLASGITALFDHAGLFAGVLLGGTMSLIIITGMHYALIPIMIGTVAQLGYDYILPIMFVANLAQAGAAFGVFLKSRNKEFKSIAMSTSITATMGITEPAMYGVNMRLKKPFIAALIGGAVSGAFISLFNTKAYIVGGNAGLPGLPILIGETFWYAIIGMLIAFVVGAVVTYLLGFVDIPSNEAKEESREIEDMIEIEKVVEIGHTLVKSEQIYSPLAGVVHPLQEVSDPTFSREIMGKGIAIEPAEGRVVSPVNGTVVSIFNTKHAIGLISDEGAEVLIHIGIDTVKLEGKHFTAHVQTGQQVKVGELLIEFDLHEIRQAGFETITPVIITNTDQYPEIQPSTQAEMKETELLLTLRV